MTPTLLPAIHDWPDWSAVFTDADYWRPAIEWLWSAEPALAVRSGVARIETMTAGFPGTCAVFILNGTAVIKLFPPMVAGDFVRERAVYRLLDGRLPEMPRLLADGVLRDHIDWPYLVTSFLPGAAWREAQAAMPKAQQLAVARVLGERIGRVHTKPFLPDSDWPPTDAWPRFVAARLAEAPAALRATLPERVAAEAEALLRSMEWFDEPPRLLHGDLTQDHALVTEQDGVWSLSGLIDWADAEIGHPGYEWVALYFGFCDGDVALLRAFLSGYDPGRAGWLPDRRRLLAYALLHRFGAHIIAGVLPDETRRNLAGLDELAGRLFAGFEI
jgi:hygromycin-B 7''-O-kinase